MNKYNLALLDKEGLVVQKFLYANSIEECEQKAVEMFGYEVFNVYPVQFGVDDNKEVSIQEALNQGHKIIYLNGFKEHINYALSLTNIKYVGETKSDDGYSFIPCYETV